MWIMSLPASTAARATSNLALACCFRIRRKGPKPSGLDPDSNEVARLYHPREMVWAEHFEWQGAKLRGRTAIGRATLQTLCLNRPDAVAVRHLRMREGVFALD